MKRFLLILFTLLYIGVISGITLDYHYCMGRLADVSVWHDVSCPSCGEKANSHTCCSTQTEVVQLVVDQNVSPAPAIAFTPVVIALLFDRLYQSMLCEPEDVNSSWQAFDTPPESNSLPLFVHHCTFLI